MYLGILALCLLMLSLVRSYLHSHFCEGQFCSRHRGILALTIFLPIIHNVPRAMDARALLQMYSFEAELQSGDLRIVSDCGILSLLSDIPQDHLPGHGTAHSGRGPSMSITNQDSAPQACLPASLMELFSHSSSQLTSLCQVDKN